jgi:TetR/AcrR family transcriptional regulator
MNGPVDESCPTPQSFHTPTFERIGDARREELLVVALKAFADKGFNGTSINALARSAGISIGSLYSYFPTKSDLFLTIVTSGQSLLEGALSDINPDESIFVNLRIMLERAHDYALSHPEYNQIYIDAMTHGLRHLSARLSKNLENAAIRLYQDMLLAAMKRGEVRSDLDIAAAAFCIDNIFTLYQFSFASDYFNDRLHLFLGLPDDADIDNEKLMAGILDFVFQALKA